MDQRIPNSQHLQRRDPNASFVLWCSDSDLSEQLQAQFERNLGTFSVKFGTAKPLLIPIFLARTWNSKMAWEDYCTFSFTAPTYEEKEGDEHPQVGVVICTYQICMIISFGQSSLVSVQLYGDGAELIRSGDEQPSWSITDPVDREYFLLYRRVGVQDCGD